MDNVLSERGLITRKKLADDFGVSESTIARWEDEEKMPVIKIGDQRLYDADQIADWLKARAV